MRVIGLAGWSGAGKTTLLRRLIPALTARGLTVSTLKHAHHAFDIDRPGKDSHVHREAGAHEVIVASSGRWALIHELRGAPEPGLADLLRKLAPVDLALVEGFKAEAHPKFEIHRTANGQPLLFRQVREVRFIAADVPVPDTPCPVVALNDVEAVAAHVLRFAEPLADVVARLEATPALSAPLRERA